MQFNKKILAIALSISFHGAIMGMEQENTLEQSTLSTVNIPLNGIMIKKLWEQLNVQLEQTKKEAEQQGETIAGIIAYSNLNKENMAPLAIWLKQTQNYFPDKQWHQIIEKLSSSILMYNHDNHPKSKYFEDVAFIIKNVAYKLHPNDDCLESLIINIKLANFINQ